MQASTPVEQLSPLRAKKRLFLLRELAYRRMQALKLYEPLPKQDEFHKCQSPERLILGGNRGAKTMCCAAEVAMAVTGNHPYLNYPKEDGRWMCVAKDGIKVGEVFYRKLFMPGAFKMVKDGTTGLWRAWRPWVDGWNIDRRNALPLIPRRDVVAIAWEDKKLNQPKKITMRNGWEILFFTSAGKPMESVDLDGAWFDEEIYEKTTLGSWYDETAARLIDRSGRFIWSATPQAATAALWKIHEAAEEDRGKENPLVSEFHVTMDDNPYLPEKSKAEFRQKEMRDPDEYRVRVLGEFLMTSHFVYPNFKKTKHTCPMFEIPPEWCRYLVVDPGYANVVGLLFAVPPPIAKIPHVYVYDEVYGHQWDAKTFVAHLKPKMMGQTFQAFIIDRHGSIKTEANGKTIGQQYAEEMAKAGLRSSSTGSQFIPIGDTGSQNSSPLKMGCSEVRSWLWDRDEYQSTPKLQIFNHCEGLIGEMGKYRNKIIKGKATDTPDGAQHSHGPDCIRYAVVHGLPYVEPRVGERPMGGPLRYLHAKWKATRKGENQFVNLGPGRGR